MFKYLFTLLFFCSGYLSAQQKFIEVNVSDTVLVEADVYVYTLDPDPEMIYAIEQMQYKAPELYKQKIEQIKKKEGLLFDSIRTLLTSKGFRVLSPSTSDTFLVDVSSSATQSTQFLIHSFDSLAMMYSLIKNIKNIIATVEIAKALDESGYEQLLYKKLLDQANRRVKIIANYSNQKVGGMLTVSDNRREDAKPGQWRAYPPFSNLARTTVPGWNTDIDAGSTFNIGIADPINNKYPIAGSITVRFSVE